MLPMTFDSSSGLFSHKTVWRDGLRNVGTNGLYSAAALVGLLSDDCLEVSTAGLIEPTLDVLLGTIRRSASRSLMGVGCWALSLAEHSAIQETVNRIEQTFDPRRASSMDLGLTLQGLSVAAENLRLRDRALRLAGKCELELRRRFVARAGVFRAQPFYASPQAVIHARMTGFASQVYPLLGLAGHAAATGTPVASEALQVADWLVASQGVKGQWWWFYGTRRRSVIEPYPVYSVHQDAMAYMALIPLESHASCTFEEPLARGLQWFLGENELETPLIDAERPFFTRAIQRSGGDADGFAGWTRRQHLAAIAASVSPWRSGSLPAEPSQRLEVLCETRPYHLGWILYAQSLLRGRNGR
jgi:hypothetical protein